jgi:hypothetical protein
VQDGGQLRRPESQPGRQAFRLNDIYKIVLGQIAPTLIVPEPIAHDHVLAAVAQRRNNMGADESGAARD